jgi:cellulose biosynthesis protein BcsQ
MHVVAIASQKGGAGKSTFAVNLAVLADREASPALLIDMDEQGSLSVWQSLRKELTPLVVPSRPDELAGVLETARRDGRVKWAFLDAPPLSNENVAAMLRAASLVIIPARPSVFDLSAIAATISMAHDLRRPFFVALNAVPARRGVSEMPDVIRARNAIRRMNAPLWRGSISQRTALAQALASGQSAVEFNPNGIAAQEFQALWADICRVANATSQDSSARA